MNSSNNSQERFDRQRDFSVFAVQLQSINDIGSLRNRATLRAKQRARGAAPRTSSKFSLVRKKRITQHYQRLTVQARIRCRHAVEFSRVRRTASIQQMFDFHLAPVRCGCFKVANQLTNTYTKNNNTHVYQSLTHSTISVSLYVICIWAWKCRNQRRNPEKNLLIQFIEYILTCNQAHRNEIYKFPHLVKHIN